MDPITAVGFAASILTFIDFSHKLVTGTLQVVDAGTTTETRHAKVVVDDLHRMTEGLSMEFSDSDSAHETALRSLAADCKALSEKLETVLQKQIAKSDSKWEAVKVAFRSMYKKGEVAEMVAQLGQYRSEILTRLSLILKYCSTRYNSEHKYLLTAIK